LQSELLKKIDLNWINYYGRWIEHEFQLPNVEQDGKAQILKRRRGWISRLRETVQASPDFGSEELEEDMEITSIAT